jgi:hypothetical protein
MTAHPGDIFRGGIRQSYLALLIKPVVKVLVRPVLGRLRIKLSFLNGSRRNSTVFVQFQMPFKRMIRLVGSGKSDLKKNGILTPVIRYPGYSGITDKDIGMEPFLLLPRHPLKLFPPLRITPVPAAWSFFSVQGKVPPPVVIRNTPFQEIGSRVLHDNPFIEGEHIITG